MLTNRLANSTKILAPAVAATLANSFSRENTKAEATKGNKLAKPTGRKLSAGTTAASSQTIELAETPQNKFTVIIANTDNNTETKKTINPDDQKNLLILYVNYLNFI